MSILDRVHDRGPEWPAVLVLDPAERLRLTVEARKTAVRAAAEYIASGRSDGRALLDCAEVVEAWILRDNPPENPTNDPRKQP